ncbi:25673_t:CDS:2, partial [Racocetra persica]
NWVTELSFAGVVSGVVVNIFLLFPDFVVLGDNSLVTGVIIGVTIGVAVGVSIFGVTSNSLVAIKISIGVTVYGVLISFLTLGNSHVARVTVGVAFLKLLVSCLTLGTVLFCHIRVRFFCTIAFL